MIENREFNTKSSIYCPSRAYYKRWATREVMVGKVGVGGSNPIRVQSMTTTPTLDTAATIAQAKRLVEVGCEIVRITAQGPKEAANQSGFACDGH